MQRHGGFESQQLGAPWPLFGSVCPSMAGCLVVGKWVGILGVLLVFLGVLLFCLNPLFEKGARLQGKGFVLIWWKKNVGGRPPSPKIGAGHSLFVGHRRWAPCDLYPKKLKAACGRNLFE